MKDYIKYAASVIGIFLVIILLVISFNLIKNALKRDPQPKKQTTTTSNTTKQVNLLDAGKASRPVVFTVRGNINGQEEHRIIRFTVDPSMRRVEIIEGYAGKVIKTQQLPNTKEGYDAFISALNGAGFTKSLPAEGRGDETQSCPVGKGYRYEIAPGTSDAYKAWSVNCSRKLGTFNGNGDLIQTLFHKQFPDYNKFISGTRLG